MAQRPTDSRETQAALTSRTDRRPFFCGIGANSVGRNGYLIFEVKPIVDVSLRHHTTVIPAQEVDGQFSCAFVLRDERLRARCRRE